jgi:hypothetical protein
MNIGRRLVIVSSTSVYSNVGAALQTLSVAFVVGFAANLDHFNCWYMSTCYRWGVSSALLEHKQCVLILSATFN